ncbi:MAG: AAA family ATPase [Alicyclobacillus macrosporangiidus]|uniref:AAA family ATPase n=1 Tax=Alicyclobacillus macrosporangiidus TaxID=392015 RepID=UPI0026EFEEFB|nr:AAA family ATPase [Alicyclobacillus macrosporangiidus]MCL6598168.1 AAA family ATPase [Alicyclobacillus macrosporangiidus]
MKPIRLCIEGMHSYRERQEVQFEALCDTGMFGIFGPTGSGKSTLLDAITLALYGDVQRAANNTQGILNHAERRLSVLFEFEVGANGADRRRYRVERTYRRGEGASVLHVGSRLTLLEDGEPAAVIADTKQEVTQHIKHILGLDLTDFTRAVVLPQGKFAEFLQLSGGERNRMLERLFGLERFGGRLAQRVRQRADEAEAERRALVAELQGLGDASGDAVAGARRRLEEAEGAARAAEAALRAAQKAFEEAGQVWAAQEDLARVEARQAELAEQEDRMRRDQDRLARAERADAVQPALERLRRAERQVAEIDGEKSRLAAEVEALQRGVSEAKAVLQASRSRLDTEGPRLAARREQLRELVEVERETEALRAQWDSIRATIAALEDQRSSAQTARAAAEGQMRRIQADIAEAEAAVRARSLAADGRQALQRAALAADAWASAARAWADADKGWKERRTALRQAEARAGQAAAAAREAEAAWAACQTAEPEAPPVDEIQVQRLEVQRAEWEAWAGRIEAAERQLSRRNRELREAQAAREASAALLAEAEAGAAQAAAARAEAEQVLQSLVQLDEQRWAAVMAARLADGVPCPVCGSLHHPSPARHPDDVPDGRRASAEAAYAEAAAACERAVEALEARRIECAAAERLYEQRQADWAEAQGELERLWQALRERWPELRDAASSAALMQCAERCAEAAAQARAVWNAWRQRQGEAQRVQMEARERWAEAQRLEAAAEAALAAVTREEAAAAAVAREATEALRAQSQALWDAVRSLQAMQDRIPPLRDAVDVAGADPRAAAAWVKQVMGRVAQQDQEAEQWARRLDDLRAALEPVQRQVEQWVKTLAELEPQLASRQAEARALSDSIRDRQERVRRATGDQPAADALADAEGRLQALAEAVAQAEQRHASASASYEQTGRRLAELEGRLRTAEEERSRAEADLAKQLADHGFATPQEAVDARLDAAEKASLREAIEGFVRERDQLALERERILRKLGGRHLSAAAWAAVQAQRDEAERAWRAVIAEEGAARDSLREVEARHAQWRRVEEALRARAAEADRLAVLRDLVRGNAFVEFVAQEQLQWVVRTASDRLSQLTRGRYGLALGADGSFVIQDHHNGGVTRPVSTLSGGETFVTSLALALSLSAHIQLRGRYPLEFFFLDEGFGTLDPDLLDVVLSTLERLRVERMTIGVISHVPELRQRMQRRLLVEPAEPAGRGTRLRIERA